MATFTVDHPMGVPEAEMRMVEGMHQHATVVVREGASEEFEVKIVHSSTGPHQQEDGDEGCHEETPLCRRPDLGGEWQTGAIQETLDEWYGLFTRHGQNINLENTEVLHIGHQRGQLDIELEGKKLTLRGTVSCI